MDGQDKVRQVDASTSRSDGEGGTSAEAEDDQGEDGDAHTLQAERGTGEQHVHNTAHSTDKNNVSKPEPHTPLLHKRQRSDGNKPTQGSERQPGTNIELQTNVPLLENNNRSQTEAAKHREIDIVEPHKSLTRSYASVRDIDEVLDQDRCADIKLYIVNYCFILAFYMIQHIYSVGVVRTIERKFGLRSAQSGFIMSMNDIAHILAIIFVSYFGKKAHIPKFMSLSLLLTALAGLMMASPYMIFGDGSTLPDRSPTPKTLTSDNGNATYHTYSYGAEETDPMVCDPSRENEACTIEEIEMDSANMAAYHIMLAAQFIGGVGGSSVTTLGFAYIDENTSSHKSGLYIGLAGAVMSISPVAALGLAAICLRLPENPLQITNLMPEDPQWIGCWWLGYVISATGITLSCIPMWFFPKHINKHHKKTAVLPENSLSIREELKELPKSLWRLLRNGPYMVLVLMSILLIYGMMCLYINMPRYFEIHFNQPAFVANFVAVSAAVASVIGNITSGLIMHKMKLKPKGATKLLIISISSLVTGVALNMCLGCPQLQMAGEWQDNGELTPTTECNTNCSCSDSNYMPMCGEDGVTYFSPCHAGCSNNNNGNYSGCDCVPAFNDTMGGNIDSGKCDTHCDMMLPYIFINVLFSFIGSLCRVPATIVMFRVVGDEQRAFALGINSFLCNLLAFMPSPVLFGVMIDSTCLMWESTCSGTGSCLLYDSRLFRLAIHGTSLAFKFLTFLCTILVFNMIRNMKFVHEEAGSTEEETEERKAVAV